MATAAAASAATVLLRGGGGGGGGGGSVGAGGINSGGIAAAASVVGAGIGVGVVVVDRLSSTTAIVADYLVRSSRAAFQHIPRIWLFSSLSSSPSSSPSSFATPHHHHHLLVQVPPLPALQLSPKHAGQAARSPSSHSSSILPHSRILATSQAVSIIPLRPTLAARVLPGSGIATESDRHVHQRPPPSGPAASHDPRIDWARPPMGFSRSPIPTTSSSSTHPFLVRRVGGPHPPSLLARSLHSDPRSSGSGSGSTTQRGVFLFFGAKRYVPAAARPKPPTTVAGLHLDLSRRSNSSTAAASHPAVAEDVSLPGPADFAKMRVTYEPQTRSYRLSVPLPTTTGGDAAEGGGGVCLFPLDPTRRLSELLADLEEEFRPVVSRVTATYGQFQSIADDEDKITLDAFVRGNFVVWLHPRAGAGRLANAKSASPSANQSSAPLLPSFIHSDPSHLSSSSSSSSISSSTAAAAAPPRGLVVDKADLLGRLSREQSRLTALDAEVDGLTPTKERLDARVAWTVWVLKTGVLATMIAQLAVIVYFTYTIGWDVMEPVSYILGLVNATAVGLYYLGVSDSPEAHLTRVLQRWSYRWNRFDAAKYQALVDERAAQAAVVAWLRGFVVA
ncbi:hypothetical protein DFJ73DRAFT_800107 [Zopfochytrium polystomum]|nr:hypothetical protein DFJ73DRAFT_800107 [Zopfochytrium polystomum]